MILPVAITPRAMQFAATPKGPRSLVGHFIMPNITPDPETGVGTWTKAEIVIAIREGKRPDGSIIGPPMPIPVYQKLSDNDAEAMAAYLLSLKPIHNAVARTQYYIPLPTSYGPPITHIEAPTDKVAYGRYLAGPVGHCVLCHTPSGNGMPWDMSRAFSGGRELHAESGVVVVSRNITPDPETGIGKWNDTQIKAAITAGVRPDGTKLAAAPMPYDWYDKIGPDDLDAIVAYLRSLKPVKNQ